MSEKKIVKPIAFAVGAALAGSFALSSSIANGETVESPFAMSTLTAGYMLSAGEGACGGDKGAKEGEATCGGDKEGEATCGGDKEGEATCGADKEGEATCGADKEGEATCGADKEGEASCGGDKEKAEGSCGEGSCGADTGA